MINGYPYTDLHELNADWLLSKTAELEGKVKDLEDAPEGVTSVTPYYHNGTKIADYEQNGVAGEIYIPDNPAVLEKSAINRFDDGIDSYFKKVVSTIVPVQAGSGTPSPTNVRAISGFTECVVTVNCKNLFNKATVTANKGVTINGAIVNSTWCNLSDYIKVTPNQTYYISHGVGSSALSRGCYYDINKNYVTFIPGTGSGDSSGSFTVPNNCEYIRLNISTIQLDVAQLELGTTATAYEPYKANTATISFGSAGTVYGGTVDLISGELVVDSAMVDLGSLNWNYNSSEGHKCFNTSITGIKQGNNSTPSNILCEKYETDSWIHVYNNSSNYIIGIGNDYKAYIYDKDYTDTAAFKTAMNGVQLVYELAIPQTYQLTPTQLRSLVGANRLTSSTGEVTEVEYIKNKTIAWLLDLIRA